MNGKDLIEIISNKSFKDAIDQLDRCAKARKLHIDSISRLGKDSYNKNDIRFNKNDMNHRRTYRNILNLKHSLMSYLKDDIEVTPETIVNSILNIEIVKKDNGISYKIIEL